MTTKQLQLENIEQQINKCKKCKLCETALNAVPGEGNVNATIVFIGEAPGANEDKTGKPFVGRAGKLLDLMLNKIDMNRQDVWIGNVIKHRPPKNRDPMPNEIKSCEPFLTQQLSIIQPQLIVTLGRFALNYFYPEGKISIDHGNLLKIDAYNIYPIYHPAAALRNKGFAKALLEDFIQIPKIINEINNEVSINNQIGLFK